MSEHRLKRTRDAYQAPASRTYQEEEERLDALRDTNYASNQFLRSEVSAWKRVVAALIRQIELGGGRARMSDKDKHAAVPVISSQYNHGHCETIFYLPEEQ